MRIYSKIVTGIFLSCLLSTSYAINVSVQSTSKDISALGFTVNGKNHGGMGTSYSAKDMPTGSYSFGIRVGGVISGKDIPCNANGSKKNVNLNKDTNAILEYNGTNCILKIS